MTQMTQMWSYVESYHPAGIDSSNEVDTADDPILMVGIYLHVCLVPP
jgi:hypothetical protein